MARWLVILLVLPFAAVEWYTFSGNTYIQQLDSTDLKITVQTAGGEQRIGVTEFLTGVLAGQIAADDEMETLKAQAIIARSCLYAHVGSRQYVASAETGLEWKSESERRKAWGSLYQENNEKVKRAVQETEDMVLCYQDKIIAPAFFALSNGTTRSSQEAWGEEIPWLQSVKSEWDTEAPDYETVMKITRRQLISELKQSISDFSCLADSLEATFQILEKDSAGYVLQLQIGNKLLSGDDFRYALNLPSACFELAFQKNLVIITVKGDGHGVGFDQYGANRQALAGKTCDALLQYYLSGVKIVSLSTIF
jgi:stage II sporulation protein D